MFPALQQTQNGGLFTRTRNLGNRLMACPKEANLFPGEKHLQLGRCTASYAGPGTRWFERADRGDVGTGPIDAVCAYNHDREYAKAGVEMHRGTMDKTEAGDLVRGADHDFLACVDKYKGTAPRNARIARAGFRAKMMGEDMGVAKKHSIAKLSKRDLGDMDRLGESRVDELLSTARTDFPPAAALEKLRGQTGLGKMDSEQMKKVYNLTRHCCQEGGLLPSHKNIANVLKAVVQDATGDKRIGPEDPTFSMQKNLGH